MKQITQEPFSVIIPFYNEAENLGALHRELVSALSGNEYELVYVDDGSTDDSLAELRRANDLASAPHAAVIRIPENRGQSFAFKAGLDSARFGLAVFMDADLQNDPRDIPRFLEKTREGYDLVQGIRRHRRDPFLSRVVPSVTANLLLRLLCGSKFRDIGCSLKAFRKSLAAEMVFQQGMHRMLPVYFYLNGARVTEIPVNHRKRAHGRSKYGFSRTLEVLFEIVKINFFEKNSNRFLFLSAFLAAAIFSYAALDGAVRLPAHVRQAAARFIFAAFGFYLFVVAAVLYIVRSFYLYHKFSARPGDFAIERYDKKSA